MTRNSQSPPHVVQELVENHFTSFLRASYIVRWNSTSALLVQIWQRVTVRKKALLEIRQHWQQFKTFRIIEYFFYKWYKASKVLFSSFYLNDFTRIHSVKKVPGIDHSKSPLKKIGTIFFDAKLAPLSYILTRSSSAICHLVCSLCSMLSVYLKCVSRFFQWIRISNKDFVSNVSL